jgi:hypothetical protein
MRVRIIKVPPASVLEGLDLRPLRLKLGETRELKDPIAGILVAWGYARAAGAVSSRTVASRVKPARVQARPTKKARPRAKK